MEKGDYKLMRKIALLIDQDMKKNKPWDLS